MPEITVSNARVVIYVRYFLPGAFFPEEDVREVPDRNPEREARKAPDNAYGFMYLNVVMADAQLNGGTVELRSDPSGPGRKYYIGGQLLTADGVRALPGGNAILLANMKSNHWDRVVQCRTGNFQPFEKDDQILAAP